jgi:hypothetical protein
MQIKSGLIKIGMAVGSGVIIVGLISLFVSCDKEDDGGEPNVPSNGNSSVIPENGNSTGEKTGKDFKVTLSEGSNFFELINGYLSQAGDLQRVAIVNETGDVLDIETTLEQGGLLFPFDDQLQTMEMYIYWGADDLGPSEALLITNEKTLEANLAKMKEWEKYMVNDLKKFILIGEKYDLVEASGQKDLRDSQRYKNTRFVNFTQDEAVSLNYTVGNNFILIANSVSIQEQMLQKIARDLEN